MMYMTRLFVEMISHDFLNGGMTREITEMFTIYYIVLLERTCNNTAVRFTGIFFSSMMRLYIIIIIILNTLRPRSVVTQSAPFRRVSQLQRYRPKVRT